MTLGFAGRVLTGSVVALIVVVLLQSANNAVFDPLFEAPRSGVERVPVGISHSSFVIRHWQWDHPWYGCFHGGR